MKCFEKIFTLTIFEKSIDATYVRVLLGKPLNNPGIAMWKSYIGF